MGSEGVTLRCPHCRRDLPHQMSEADVTAMVEEKNRLVRQVSSLEDEVQQLRTCPECGVRYDRENGGACSCEVKRFKQEVRKLKEQIEGHCERIAKQSELLSRKAMKPELVAAMETADG